MKLLIFFLLLIGLVACKSKDQSFFYPEASYFNGKQVAKINKNKGITIVGSFYDDMRNVMPSFPAPYNRAHKVVHLTPIPKMVKVECEHTAREVINNTNVTTTKYGSAYAVADFQPGKTYMVFCSVQADNRYRIKVREVPQGASYQSGWMKKKIATEKPTNANRVRFVTMGKKSAKNWLRGAGGNHIAIRGWDGKLAKEAELAGPVSYVEVECRSLGKKNIVPLKGYFQAGKTYQLACRTNREGLFEVYVVNNE